MTRLEFEMVRILGEVDAVLGAKLRELREVDGPSK
jgi:hypothetical protein